MASQTFSEMDSAHQSKAAFVSCHLDPMLAAARDGWGASYETDGEEEYVCLQTHMGARSVRVTGCTLWEIVVSVAKVLRK